MKHANLLIVSQAFPPEVSGSATLLTNILGSFEGDCTAIAGFSRYTKRDETLSPPCKTIYIKPPKIKLLELGYAKIVNNFRFIVRNQIRRQVKKNRPDVIMGVFPHSTFFIAAFEVAKEMNIPFFAHMHDLWQENYPDGYYAKKLADKYEKVILSTATRVLCMTSSQQDHYKKKYNIDSDIIAHSIPSEVLANVNKVPSTLSLPKTTFLFAGAVSSVMNEDALGFISRSLSKINIDFDLLICSNIDIETLKLKGYETKNIRLKWVSKQELEILLSSADILLAPLSFKNCSEDEVRTVFSTKLLEYLIAGKPILVFGPKDCFHVLSAKEGNWAYVVDQEDEVLFAEKVQHVLDNKSESEIIVKNAFVEAEKRNSRIIANNLLDLILKYRLN